MANSLTIFLAFLRLGCTSFGGPIAHLGYFRSEFVNRRKWLSDEAFADLVALAQFLPGPASSQTGFALGLMHGGLPGGLAAWAGFTLPSALLMLLAAYGLSYAESSAAQGLIHGLKLLAVAVVAQAVWSMGGTSALTGSGPGWHSWLPRSDCDAGRRPAIGSHRSRGSLGLRFSSLESSGDTRFFRHSDQPDLRVRRDLRLLSALTGLPAVAAITHRRSLARQCLFPYWRPRLWRRPCCASAAARNGGEARLGGNVISWQATEQHKPFPVRFSLLSHFLARSRSLGQVACQALSSR